MSKRVIMPLAFQRPATELKMSPAIISGGHVFLGGVTGSDSKGRMPQDPAAQMRSAFDKIEIVLREAGLTFRDVVEMTTYHIGLRDHFDLFNAIRLEYVSAPYPAWTAIEAAGLRREGAIVEIRVIAQLECSIKREGI